MTSILVKDTTGVKRILSYAIDQAEIHSYHQHQIYHEVALHPGQIRIPLKIEKRTIP